MLKVNPRCNGAGYKGGIATLQDATRTASAPVAHSAAPSARRYASGENGTYRAGCIRMCSDAFHIYREALRVFNPSCISTAQSSMSALIMQCAQGQAENGPVADHAIPGTTIACLYSFFAILPAWCASNCERRAMTEVGKQGSVAMSPWSATQVKFRRVWLGVCVHVIVATCTVIERLS